MAKQRPSNQKREREFKKRERDRRKQEKAALKRLRRHGDPETTADAPAENPLEPISLEEKRIDHEAAVGEQEV